MHHKEVEATPMKKLLVYLVALIFVFSSGILYAGENDHRKGNNYKKNEVSQKYDHRNNYSQHRTDTRNDSHRYRGEDYNNRKYHPQNYRGYRSQYSGNRNHHPQNYRGHWNSWNEWDTYYRNNRNQYRNGRYYKDSQGSLYFAFDTGEGSFAFSIGR